MPVARFFFDYHAGLLWSADPPTTKEHGYLIDLRSLGLSSEICDDADRLLDWFDASLNWDYPPDPGPWREEECVRFNAAARSLLAALQAALGQEWTIIDEFRELHEDPDLDRYLADPKAFRRSE